MLSIVRRHLSIYCMSLFSFSPNAKHLALTLTLHISHSREYPPVNFVQQTPLAVVDSKYTHKHKQVRSKKEKRSNHTIQIASLTVTRKAGVLEQVVSPETFRTVIMLQAVSLNYRIIGLSDYRIIPTRPSKVGRQTGKGISGTNSLPTLGQVMICNDTGIQLSLKNPLDQGW